MVKKVKMKRAKTTARAPVPKVLKNPLLPSKALKRAIMTEQNLVTPVHLLVQEFQSEAILTLLELMRDSKNDATRQKAATEILALGGNSAEMLKVQAIMSGRNKDVSQMTTQELETFVREARRKLELKQDIAAHNAANVTPEQDMLNPANPPPGAIDPSPFDGLEASVEASFGL